MDRRHLSFFALAITMLYGASFAVFDSPPKGYAALGGVVVALCWIAVGVFGKDATHRGDATPDTLQDTPQDTPRDTP